MRIMCPTVKADGTIELIQKMMPNATEDCWGWLIVKDSESYEPIYIALNKEAYDELPMLRVTLGEETE